MLDDPVHTRLTPVCAEMEVLGSDWGRLRSCYTLQVSDGRTAHRYHEIFQDP
jgi:hypothetical protein